MFSALLYLQYHTVRNRLVFRLKRLKKPKYLIGAIVGGLYIYFYFFRYLFHLPGTRPKTGFALSPEQLMTFELLGAFVLFVIVLLAWIIPRERAALTFTEAEVAFLFPAPVSRRNLIHFKLARSQFRIFFTVILLTLFSRGLGGNMWIHFLGLWLILSTLNLHFLGSSFVRTILLDRGISNGLRRLIVFVLAAALVVGIWIWAKKTVPGLNSVRITDLGSAIDYLKEVLTAGPALYLLYPFRLAIRPLLAPDAIGFLRAVGPALLLFVLHYMWVMWSDVAFEEASVEASKKMASRVAAARSGNWQRARKNQKAKRPWFNLSPTGPKPTAFLWKNLLGIGQVFSPRLWIMLTVIIVVLGFSMGNIWHNQNLSVLGAILVGIALAYSVFLGPQLLRLDFRHDLPLADVLKVYPLRGWQIALGEILAPVAVLAVLQWLLLLVESGLLNYVPGPPKYMLWAIALGAAVVLPLFDVLLMLIPNAAVLLFPSWIQTGKDSPRGVEATGQRLIFALGQLLALMLALIPASAAFAGVFFLIRFTLGTIIAIPLASLAAAIILVVEGGLGVMLLGKLFEKFDVAEEHTN